jgi:hypothetical protein
MFGEGNINPLETGKTAGQDVESKKREIDWAYVKEQTEKELGILDQSEQQEDGELSEEFVEKERRLEKILRRIEDLSDGKCSEREEEIKKALESDSISAGKFFEEIIEDIRQEVLGDNEPENIESVEKQEGDQEKSLEKKEGKDRRKIAKKSLVILTALSITMGSWAVSVKDAVARGCSLIDIVTHELVQKPLQGMGEGMRRSLRDRGNMERTRQEHVNRILRDFEGKVDRANGDPYELRKAQMERDLKLQAVERQYGQ